MLKSNTYNEYLQIFCNNKENYIVQMPNSKWITKNKILSDIAIQSHLEQKYWIGVKSGWYPYFGIIDIDTDYLTNDKDIAQVESKLKLDSNNYILCTSPSGRTHLLFIPLFKGKPPTYKLFENILKQRALPYELYPQKGHGIRLPFGRQQYIYNFDTKEQYNYSWDKAMYWVHKIEPLELAQFQRQLDIEFPIEQKISLPANSEIRELYENGLQCLLSRHNSCFLLAGYLIRQNIHPDIIKNIIKRWIRIKHNGYSKEVNKGHWRLIDKEIERQVNWWSEKLINTRQYPDTVHNIEGFICRQDIYLIKDIFPDYTNRRRFFRLLAYCRPRIKHERIFIPYWQWWKIIGNKNEYIIFRNSLVNRGIIEFNNSYQVLEYPKSIKLNIKLQDNNRIEIDNRAIQDYDLAVLNMTQGLNEYQTLTGASMKQYYIKLKDVKKIL